MEEKNKEEKNKFEELYESRALRYQELEKSRAAVTILFSDIKGSTSYFERKGDVEGMAMVQRHNDLLFPAIEACSGRVVKTIGDAIMASFTDQAGAVKAAIRMQQALAADREDRKVEEQIHIRIGLHTGLGLVRDNDVFGDVVNVASRVQNQAEPDQIIITGVLLDAAKGLGAQCAKLGLVEVRGREEPIELFAVAWSVASNEQLIELLQARFERKVKERKRQQELLEEEFDNARDQWRQERRRLTAEIERHEDAAKNAAEHARSQVSSDLQSELRFQLQEALRARREMEQEFGASQLKWETECTALRTQIASMQGSLLESMERSNNPARQALTIREAVEARLERAREEWQLEAEGERRRLIAEIDRIKKAGGVDARKEAAKQAILKTIRKGTASEGPAVKTAAQWAVDFEDAKAGWESERNQLILKMQQVERTAQASRDDMRSELFEELRGQYEPRLTEASADRQRLDRELAVREAEFEEERERYVQRIAALEQSVPEAQEAVRTQVTAELTMEYDSKIEELSRLKARAERLLKDQSEEADVDRRRLRKQVSALEEQLKEARESLYRAQRQKVGN